MHALLHEALTFSLTAALVCPATHRPTLSFCLCASLPLPGVVAHLEAEFKSLAGQRDATIRTLEPRIRNMRYIGELCKFRSFPFGSAFSMLKVCTLHMLWHPVRLCCFVQLLVTRQGIAAVACKLLAGWV